MEQEKKYYTSSDGTTKVISEMNTEYLLNALGKKYRTLFESTSKNDYAKRIAEINDLKEDLYRRFNDFYDKLGDDNG